MKIVTLGLSPYVYLSHARIHSLILKHLYFSNHEVACAASGHDITYFLPQLDDQGNPRFYYSFDDHHIPLVPINEMKDPAIMVYEIVQAFKPDMMLTIGDFNDHLYMKAVKMFVDDPIKWFAVLANHSDPINEKNIEALEDMDGILCTDRNSHQMFCNLFKKDNISISHLGCVPDIMTDSGSSDKFRIMSCGKNIEDDNLPMLMEVVSGLPRIDFPDVELYLHTNVHDPGHYDLNLLKERFDSKDLFIKFPDKYVSLTDGYSIEDYRHELAKSDIFVSISRTASSAISVFDAISSGCLPLMSDVGSHRDVAGMLSNYLPGFQREDFLVPCIEIMTRGEVYSSVCKPDLLREKLLSLQEKIKKGGYRSFLQEFINGHNRKDFLADMTNAIEAVRTTNSTICVESV